MAIKSIFSILFIATCIISHAQHTYDKRMKCLTIKDLKLSKGGKKAIEEGVSKFYNGAFKSNDICFGEVVKDTKTNHTGLFRGSLLNQHFPNFYFVKVNDGVSIIEANPERNMTFMESANLILEKYKDRMDSTSIIKIKEYLSEVETKQ